MEPTTTAVCVSIIVVVALGVIVYSIIKSKTKANPHATKEKTVSKSKGSANELVDFSDIRKDVKTKSKDESLRLRNIGTTSEKDIVETVKSISVNNHLSHNCNQEVQTNCVQENDLPHYKCYQEVQTDVLENDLPNRKCHQDTQTINEVSQLNNFNINSCYESTQMSDSLVNDNMFTNINALGSDNCSDARSVLDNESVSVYSFASTETVSSDTNYPTWYEMSNEEKCLCKCPSCGKIVTTVTYPCKHPYCCRTCALVLFKFYHRCHTCKHRIKSYDNV